MIYICSPKDVTRSFYVIRLSSVDILLLIISVLVSTCYFFAVMAPQMFTEKCRGYDTGIDMGEVLRSILRLIRTYKVRIDVNYATLIINLLCLEGVATALVPEYNVLDRARPLLQPHGNRFLNPIFPIIFPLLLSIKRSSDRVLYDVVRLSKVPVVVPEEDVKNKK